MGADQWWHHVLLAQNTYNEVGQVMTKKLHSADAGSTFLQSNAYTNNERGWLKTIGFYHRLQFVPAT